MPLVNPPWEAEQWSEDELYGNDIPTEKWEEYKLLWEKINELEEFFHTCPFVNNRPPRQPTVFDKFILPVLNENMYKSNMFFGKKKDS